MQQHERDRYRILTRRAALLAGAQVSLFGLLVSRLYFLQVVQADRYKMLAEENRINLRLLTPPRGRIFDRKGAILAQNKQNFRAVLVQEETPDYTTTLDRLGRLIYIDPSERERVFAESKRKRSFVPITVKEHLTWSEVSRIEVNTPELPGLSIEAGQLRHYPHGAALAHVIGYVAAVSEAELTGDPLLHLPDFRIGKNGIERTHDLPMRGSAGNLQVEVNAHGRVIRELARDEGRHGEDIQLTLDLGLQQYVADRLGEESGSAVVLDVHTGEILAIASMPSFDPNVFNQGLTRGQWRDLMENPRKPLINKSIAGQYPPGSTFKLVVAMAALEFGLGAGHTAFCPGYMKMGNRRFHCWKKGGHGTISMVDALAQSCDVYFYDLSLRVGVETIAKMANRLGMGNLLNVELTEERGGLIPTPDWKLATRGVPWQKGETLNVGIGQGYVLATPLQLAVMIARVVNGGRAIVPRLTRQIGDLRSVGARAPALAFAPHSLAVVREGMTKVVNHRRGTAYAARIHELGLEMGGKTGTSQVVRISKRERETGVIKNEDRPWHERDHALFVGFAPVEQPRYAVAVVVEHGGGGSKVAAPIARDILIEAQKRGAITARDLNPAIKRGDGDQA